MFTLTMHQSPHESSILFKRPEREVKLKVCTDVHAHASFVHSSSVRQTVEFMTIIERVTKFPNIDEIVVAKVFMDLDHLDFVMHI